jgi:hypothetical protein
VPTRLEQAKREISREIRVFQTPATADAAQLCGISAIVGCAIEFAWTTPFNLQKALAPALKSG